MKRIICVLILLNAINAFAYRISNVGKNYIKHKEQCSLVSYWDSNGYSIGWGHHGPDVKRNMRISKAYANMLFNKDIKIIEVAANRLIKDLPYKYHFSQNFFDGLCSFIYNCGESGVKQSKFYKRLRMCRVRNGIMNKHDLHYAIAHVKTSRISAPGHKSRRYDEHKLMIK